VRIISVLIVTLSLAAGAAASTGKGVPRLIFPVVGTVTYTDDFGDARPGGTHQGNDLMAVRRAPAVAVESGTVQFWATSANAGCMLYLHGESGTTYLYIHLNNDLTGHNDNRGGCVAGTSFAPGLKTGARVAAGQLVGYVGDSGDADGIHPHLHFEVHPNGGAAVSPYPYLRKAQQLIFSAKPGATVSLSLAGTIVSAFPGLLELKTSRVQANASKALSVKRKIFLSLESEPDISFELTGVSVGLNALLPGRQATVYTEPVRATLAAQRGDADVLTAASIVLKR
jgi:hypothetical protein